MTVCSEQEPVSKVVIIEMLENLFDDLFQDLSSDSIIQKIKFWMAFDLTKSIMLSLQI